MNYFKVILIIVITSGVVKADTDCSASEPECSNENECTCNKGCLVSTNSTKCLPYVTEYYGKCYEDAQCEWLGDNSGCDYVCKCQKGYRWYLGKCQKYANFGEECTDDCYDGYNLESLSCQSGKCNCSEGYYQHGDTDCRKKATEVNAICALDIDCQVPDLDNDNLLLETVCHVGKCLQPSEIPLRLEIEEAETRSLEATAVTNCTTKDNCTDPNSECYDKTGTCICKKSYFFSEEGTCIPELGVNVTCTADSDCLIKPGKCVEGVCYCRDYYFVEEGNRKCVKTISQNNWNCLSKEWCYALGTSSYCNSSGICQCSKLADCDKENVWCSRNNKTAPDNFCSDDVQCRDIQDSFCINEECGCLPNYFLVGDRCVPGGIAEIGAPCDEKNGCKIPHSQCVDERCQCDESYVAFENKMCYLKKDKLGDDCEVNDQCSASVTYSVCWNRRCSCDDNYLPDNNTCYQEKEFGSYCSTRYECSLSLSESIGDSIVCRNHLCQCPTGYTLDGNQCSSSSTIVANLFVIAMLWLVNNVFSIS